jgi:hypothetical protein
MPKTLLHVDLTLRKLLSSLILILLGKSGIDLAICIFVRGGGSVSTCIMSTELTNELPGIEH